MEIKSIIKDTRKDISNYIATFADGSTIGVEAKDKKDAEKKIEEFLARDVAKELYPEIKERKKALEASEIVE